MNKLPDNVKRWNAAHPTIDQLKEELAKAQAELGNALRRARASGDKYAALKAENARLKQYNDELCGDLLDQRGKLRDLLGPTVELEEAAAERCFASQCDLRAELRLDAARLRAAMGEK